MGCLCKNNNINQIILEEGTQYKTEFNNVDNNSNENDISFRNKGLIKVKERDSPMIDYPEIIFNLINNIRQNPKEYANIVEQEINNIKEEKNEDNPKEKKYIYQNNIKVALVRGESAFREAAEELKSMEPMKPLEFREDNCLGLPDNLDDYNNSNFLIEEVKEKLENNIHINIFYKERISDPNISALLMIVDDRGKIDSGKKRKAILNKNFKYIGITSKYIDDVFIAYFSFSKS